MWGSREGFGTKRTKYGEVYRGKRGDTGGMVKTEEKKRGRKVMLRSERMDRKNREAGRG